MIAIGTGWCAHKDGKANNPKTSKRCYEKYWLFKTWNDANVKPVKDMVKGVHVYQSNCDVKLDRMQSALYEYQIMDNIDPVETQDHAHDAYSAMITGAMYAYVNGCDYVYIEQDCLVFGLDKALEWAKGKRMVYGFGDNSFQPSWAEESFQFVAYKFIPEYISRIMNRGLVNWQGCNPAPEVMFHQLFSGSADFWPFGYGRNRPIDFNDEVFYFQQPTDEEIDFIKEMT